jgi:hypothetical protein
MDSHEDRELSRRIALHEVHVNACLEAIAETRRAINRAEKYTVPMLKK